MIAAINAAVIAKKPPGALSDQEGMAPARRACSSLSFRFGHVGGDIS